MTLAATVLTVLVLLIHVYIVILEMVLWRSRGPKVFGITEQFARDSAALASNQGLYNGFLVVALLLGLSLREPLRHGLPVLRPGLRGGGRRVGWADRQPTHPLRAGLARRPRAGSAVARSLIRGNVVTIGV